MNLNLINIYQLIARYPILKLYTIRGWLRNRNKNGLQDNGAIIMISNKLFFDEVKFLDWLQKNKIH